MNSFPEILAILSDIHGNREALETVLADIDGHGGVDCIVCLGDIVGYGPDPGACLDLIRSRTDRIIAGNHEAAAFAEGHLDRMNPTAAAAILWTVGQLSPDELQFIADLPLEIKSGPFHFVHGSPVQPAGFDYIMGISMAEKAFLNSGGAYIFFGHTHIPSAYIEVEKRRMFAGFIHDVRELPPENISLVSGRRYLINVGSVGQPRDGDPRAAYGLMYTEKGVYEQVRIHYDVAAVSRKIKRSGLPESLAARLKNGR